MDSAFKDKLFTSFNELQNAIQEYEEKNCVQLYKRHLGSENLLDQNSLLLLRDIPNKATNENVNIERVRKSFTKQGWKALKVLIIEKNDNLIWDCKICETDLHAKESIFCDYCLVWFHLKCTNLKKQPKSTYWCCRQCIKM